mgnify:CR=1 FL=1|tara:strand:- start:353 stop:538 length:186 start_codon:yes stop_codon:yes gene_type:complete
MDDCNTCAGTGEGLYGPIGSGVCLSCKGRGTEPSEDDIQEYEEHMEMMLNMMRDEGNGYER